MKIAVICAYPIPYGMAATTRIFSYSKGLLANGDDIEVWSYIPNGTPSSLNNKNEGNFDGIKFFYSLKCKRFKNKILHILEIILSLFILGFKLKKHDKQAKYDAFVVSSDSILIMAYMKIVNFFMKKKLVFIFDEYPIPIRKKLKSKIPNWKRTCYKLILRGYSGYISMTNNLLKYYQDIEYKPGEIISSIIDISRFDNTEKKRRLSTPYIITYMGNMELSKDNVDNIIKAVDILIKKGYNLNLELYGNPNKKDKNLLQKLITDLKIEKYIKFSFASFDEVPNILVNSDILVSSQPVTVRANGGFPTKLGEYLMSENPVLLTDVGETSKYFKDGVHMYFATPENPEKYAEKLEFILNNYDVATQIAKQGKEYIIINYSHIAMGKKMHNFLKRI